jgi:hypothetical protein
MTAGLPFHFYPSTTFAVFGRRPVTGEFMGDPSIQRATFIDSASAWYVARPGAENRDRIGFGVQIGTALNIAVDAQTSFILLLAGTVGREVPLERAGLTSATWQSTAVGGTAEVHFNVAGSGLYLGAGVNPRAVLYAQGISPEFDLGLVARMSAVFGPFGLALNAGGALRLTDIERSGFEAGLAMFVNL